MLRILDLSLTYPTPENGAPNTVFNDWSSEIKSSEIIALTGANGSGKTTLLNYIAGVIPEHIEATCAGKVMFQLSSSEDPIDLSVLKLRERFAYLSMVMSDPTYQLFFPDGESEIAFALENSGLSPAEIESRISAVTESFGLWEMLKQHPATLSYGQQKLLLFAACDAMQRPLVLLDEPFSGLSERSSDIVSRWFCRMRQRNDICIFTEHNESSIALADRQICLSLPDGR